MQTTETELVEVYGRSNPHERFDLIYKNYEGKGPNKVMDIEKELQQKILPISD